MIKKYKVLDSHVHVYPEKIADRAAENLGRFYNYTVTERGTFEFLTESCAECGINGFLLLPVATSPDHVGKINEFNASLVKNGNEAGLECYAMGCVHQDCPDFGAVTDEALRLGLLGFKIHPDLQRVDIDDPKLFSLYGLCAEKGLRIYFHMGDNREDVNWSDPMKLVKTTELFPTLKICAAHMGGYREWKKSYDNVLGRYDNVWYDCSATIGSCDDGFLVEMIRKAGAERVFFGTDFPSVSQKKVLADFMRLELTEEEREKILYRNLRTFLGADHD